MFAFAFNEADGMHLSRRTTHNVWDRTIAPVVHVESGATLTVELANASGGQLSRDSVGADIRALDFAQVNPVTGPIFVAGARPGDALAVEILDLSVDAWGWTANIPGFGLLADRFPEPHLRISSIGSAGVAFMPGLEIPLIPMIGTIGVAPPEPGPHSIIPPTRWGGNMDVRHISAGARLLLPVGVAGALLSLGDPHAAQGDGEVCGTAIETSATATIRVTVERGAAPAFPRIETAARAQRGGAAIATTGIGPDLFAAARGAVQEMIGEIVRRSALAEIDAYLLASVAADLKISEIVDQPNWVVSMHLDAGFFN